MMKGAQVGSAVVSVRGKDKGRVMLIVALDSNGAYVCDGRKRRIEKPKRKNLRHLKLLSGEDACLEVNAELTNKKLWKALEPLRKKAEETVSDDKN